MKDLILLVPDTSMEKAVCAILQRRRALRIRELRFDCVVHPGRDGGVRKNAHELLRLHAGRYDNAIVMFDYHGCGEEDKKTAPQIEADVTSNLTNSGWNSANALVVVIEPELEVWVWGNSPWIARVVGWPGGDTKSMKLSVRRSGFQINPLGKPAKPKEALQDILRKTNTPRSAAIYQEMATKAGLRDCKEHSFLKLTRFLRERFPRDSLS